jgi:5'-nucleotidase
MRVLLSNDDGFDAPGLNLLRECASEIFEEVWTVAPDAQQSGMGQSITLHDPIRLHKRGPTSYCVTGSPVDSVLIALEHLMRDNLPDLVISGVNRGPNLGLDVYYSGTVAAAREARIHGVSALALSLVGQKDYPFSEYRKAVSDVIRWALDQKDEAPTLLNVNIPVVPDAALKGIALTRLGERHYQNDIIERQDPRGSTYLWIGGNMPEMRRIDGTDCQAVLDGFISVTPLRLDTTDEEYLKTLRARDYQHQQRQG